MDIPHIIFYTIFAGFACYFVYRMVRHGGFKGAMFGAKVERTVGEVAGEKQGPISTAIKVHLLNRDSAEKLVGLEFVARGFATYRTTPFALSALEAQKLVLLLQEAVRAR